MDEAIIELYETIERSLPRKNSQVRRAIEKSRLTIADILAKHANPDGTIPRGKVNVILDEILALENEIYRNLQRELRLVLEDVAQKTTIGLAEAIIAYIGISQLIEVVGLPAALAELTIGSVEAVFSALTGTTYRNHVNSTVSSAFNRIGEDGLVLNDRIRNIAQVLRNEIEVTLRQSIRRGEGTTEIFRRLEQVFSDLSWRLDVITETEALYTLRQTIGKFAEDSGIFKALKIVDFPHGEPGEHERHKCYIYAHRDEHGLGEGVYPVGTRKIRNPHPRCRSVLLPVLIDGLG